MAELKPMEVIMRIDFVSSDREQICAHAEKVQELIRCKDCIHHHYENGKIPYCDNIDYGYGWEDDDYCSQAERRTDGERCD